MMVKTVTTRPDCQQSKEDDILKAIFLLVDSNLPPLVIARNMNANKQPTMTKSKPKLFTYRYRWFFYWGMGL